MLRFRLDVFHTRNFVVGRRTPNLEGRATGNSGTFLAIDRLDPALAPHTKMVESIDHERFILFIPSAICCTKYADQISFHDAHF